MNIIDPSFVPGFHTDSGSRTAIKSVKLPKEQIVLKLERSLKMTPKMFAECP